MALECIDTTTHAEEMAYKSIQDCLQRSSQLPLLQPACLGHAARRNHMGHEGSGLEASYGDDHASPSMDPHGINAPFGGKRSKEP